MSVQMKIYDLIEKSEQKIKHLSGDINQQFSSIQYDSRQVTAGAIFIAVKGFVSDGHDFIDTAVKSGAACIVINNNKQHDFTYLKDENITLLAVADTRRALSYISALFYGDISKKIPVIGITGTNGKTSITYMLEAVFKEAGRFPGVIGTINYRWKDQQIPAPNTTPESKEIHSLLHQMALDGVDIIIMEVSSHGLDLGRVDDIHFKGAIFTNLTRDHLDYHKTFDEYFSAKKILFKLLQNSKATERFAVINVDDPYGNELYCECKNFSYQIAGYGSNDKAQYRIMEDSVVNNIQSIKYNIAHNSKEYPLDLHLAGRFNLYNSCAAFAAAALAGVSFRNIQMGLESLDAIPGRFERLKTKSKFAVIVDYAHTDDALIKLLSSARELNPARIITVFGCGGDRDTSKRPLMGKAALLYSDYVIITSDNPRTEDPQKIIEDIAAGLSDDREKFEIEPDREKAIARAVTLVKEHDFLIIAGKGHEDYQIIGKTKNHFDDKLVAKKYISMRENA